jgi:hypothetical protein
MRALWERKLTDHPRAYVTANPGTATSVASSLHVNPEESIALLSGCGARRRAKAKSHTNACPPITRTSAIKPVVDTSRWLLSVRLVAIA